jgi:hypothetical protein
MKNRKKKLQAEATPVEAEVVNENEQMHDDSVLEARPKKAKRKKAVARKDMTAAQWTWHEIKRNKIAYLMILPLKQPSFSCNHRLKNDLPQHG